MFRPLLLCLGLLSVAGIVWAAVVPPPPPPPVHHHHKVPPKVPSKVKPKVSHQVGAITITINSDHTYSPSPATVPLGSTVQWVNGDQGDVHSATSDDGSPFSFDTGVLNSGQTSAPVTMPTTPMTIPYHCVVHGIRMHGTLVVSSDVSSALKKKR